jgi:radical SAM superfamily enzyme YgiQ (UPF0313 family)
MASLRDEDYLLRQGVDFVVRGEGEYTLLDLILALLGRKVLSSVLGISYAKAGKVVRNPDRIPIAELDMLPMPLRTRSDSLVYIPSVISSRGCNHHCRFCSSSYLGKNRLRSAGSVLSELREIVEVCRARFVQFVDGNFLSDSNRAEQIAAGLIREEMDLSFDFACRIDDIVPNGRTISRLKLAGLRRVLLGIESTDDRTLKRWGKGFGVRSIIEGVTLLRGLGLPFTASMILFYPDLTLEELCRDMDAIEKYDLVECIQDIFNRLRFIPGTPLNPSPDEIPYDFDDPRVRRAYSSVDEYQARKLECRIRSEKLTVPEALFGSYYALFRNERRTDFSWLSEEVGRKDTRIHPVANVFDRLLKGDSGQSDLGANRELNQIFHKKRWHMRKNVRVVEDESRFRLCNYDAGRDFEVNNSGMLTIQHVDGRTFSDLKEVLKRDNLGGKVDDVQLLVFITALCDAGILVEANAP